MPAMSLAQERSAGSTTDIQANWSALKALVVKANTQSDAVASKVEQIVTCNKLFKLYVPGPGADAFGCIENSLINQLKTRMDTMDTTVAGLKTRMDTFEGRLAETYAKAMNAEQDAADAYKLASDANTKVAALSVQVATLNDKVKGVTDRMTTAESTISGINTQVSAINMKISNIDKQIVDLTTIVNGVKTDVTGVKTDVTGVKTDVAGVKTDVTGVKADVALTKTDIVAMKARLTKLEADVTALNSHVTQAMADIDKLEVTVSQQGNSIKALESTINKILTCGVDKKVFKSNATGNGCVEPTATQDAITMKTIVLSVGRNGGCGYFADGNTADKLCRDANMTGHTGIGVDEYDDSSNACVKQFKDSGGWTTLNGVSGKNNFIDKLTCYKFQ